MRTFKLIQIKNHNIPLLSFTGRILTHLCVLFCVASQVLEILQRADVNIASMNVARSAGEYCAVLLFVSVSIVSCGSVAKNWTSYYMTSSY